MLSIDKRPGRGPAPASFVRTLPCFKLSVPNLSKRPGRRDRLYMYDGLTCVLATYAAIEAGGTEGAEAVDVTATQQEAHKASAVCPGSQATCIHITNCPISGDITDQ